MSKSLVLVFHKEENGHLFEKIIIALKARYSLLSAAALEELLVQKKVLKNICHISFDDGEKSFYNIIFPLLKKHQVPVSLFVSPDKISRGSNYWFQQMEGFDEQVLKNIIAQQLNISVDSVINFSAMSIFNCLPVKQIENIIEQYRQQTKCTIKSPQNINTDQLRELDASGLVTIGAHTINHPVLKNEDDESCHFEITESIKRLETLLGHPVKYFAYPNGRPGIDFSEREMKCLAAHKMAMAFSTELDHLNTETDPLSIPRMGFARMGLSPSNWLVGFRLNAGKKWINLKSIGSASEETERKSIKLILGT